MNLLKLKGNLFGPFVGPFFGLLLGVVVLGMAGCSKHEDQSAAKAVEVVSSPADAALKVVNAWARPTVAEQMATGAYMKITSNKDGMIVGVTSPVAEVAEIHEMKMEGDVMRMRALESIPVKAGSTIELAPGGYHVMLMGLNQAVNEGKAFEIKVQFVGSDGGKSEIPVSVIPGKGPASGEKSGTHSDPHKH
ncbi:MAG: copper chaperone PCu(A)C [Limnobacter sp.]|nr:copper chaperone PCu(A)C [Limnobacter sp.]